VVPLIKKYKNQYHHKGVTMADKKLVDAVRYVDEHIPDHMKMAWATVKTALQKVPEERLSALFSDISHQLVTKKQCFLVREDDNIGIVKNFQVIKLD
jgi:hypothetical protein